MERIRIDALDPTVLPNRNHVMSAMKDGLTVQISVSQILSCLTRGDLDGLISAEDVSFSRNDAPLIAENIQSAIEEMCTLFVGAFPQTFSDVQRAQILANLGGVPRGHIDGLVLSNNALDSPNDIDINSGQCASDDAVPVLLSLGSPITKQLDASWTVGSGNGGLDTGTPTDGTYHVWLIRRPDTGNVDALMSLSGVSPSMPTNYTQKRRIGSILRRSGKILGFTQTGNLFSLVNPVTERQSVSAQAATLIALTVPLGIVVRPILYLRLDSSGSSVVCVVEMGDGNNSSSLKPALVLSSGSSTVQSVQNLITGSFRTTTSGQLYYSQINNTGSPAASYVVTYGWIDDRRVSI